jgi:hypothetical protein
LSYQKSSSSHTFILKNFFDNHPKGKYNIFLKNANIFRAKIIQRFIFCKSPNKYFYVTFYQNKSKVFRTKFRYLSIKINSLSKNIFGFKSLLKLIIILMCQIFYLSVSDGIFCVNYHLIWSYYVKYCFFMLQILFKAPILKKFS